MSTPTVEEFVKAAEWVMQRGWTISHSFCDTYLKRVCPLTALAWQRSGQDMPPSVNGEFGGYSEEFQRHLGMTIRELEAFYTGFDGCSHLDSFDTSLGKLGQQVRHTLVNRGLTWLND